MGKQVEPQIGGGGSLKWQGRSMRRNGQIGKIGKKGGTDRAGNSLSMGKLRTGKRAKNGKWVKMGKSAKW